jgi:hypothetical protein
LGEKKRERERVRETEEINEKWEGGKAVSYCKRGRGGRAKMDLLE